MNYEIILAIAYLLFGGGWYMEACGEDESKDLVDVIACVITMLLWPALLILMLGMFVHRNLAK